MGKKDCQIILENQRDVLYPGEIINGQFEYKLNVPKKVRGIKIEFKGESETSWKETITDSSRKKRKIEYSGKEEYFNLSYYLIGSGDGADLEIPTGKNVYRFNYKLPTTLPSSFEEKYGFIRYTIKVTLHMSKPQPVDREISMTLPIVSDLDLNLDSKYQNPFQLHLEKNFCCLFCKSAPLKVEVSLPVSGFCPAQTMPFDISCENGSYVNLNNIKIYFRKIITYKSVTPYVSTKLCKVAISDASFGRVISNSTKDSQKIMDIPQLQPSGLLNCNIMDLDYEVKVVCVASGIHKSLSQKGTVYLGTVPVDGYQPTYPARNKLRRRSSNTSSRQSFRSPNRSYLERPHEMNDLSPSAPPSRFDQSVPFLSRTT